MSKYRELSRSIKFEGRALIDGRLTDEASDYIEHPSPVDGRIIGAFVNSSEYLVNKAVESARKSFEDGRWWRLPLAERKHILLRLAELIHEHRETLAVMDSLSMGKAVKQCLNHDIPRAVECISWFAELIDKHYDEACPPRPNAIGIITREPIGVVAAITPWNYPVENVAWKIGPSLCAGNSIVLKPAEQASFSAIFIGQLALEAGLPPGVLNIIPGIGEQTGMLLACHNDIDAIFFTGSTEVGKKLHEYVAKTKIKRLALECGGKSAFIVFEDCPDMERAAYLLTKGIFINQGQTCSAPSRLLIKEELHDSFIELVKGYSREFYPGDPLDENTNVGAVCSEAQVKRICKYIDTGITEGASLILGGKRVYPVTNGCYIEPTIFTDVNNSQTIAQEEIFGPVLSVIKFNKLDEAIRLANSNQYGLTASIWTKDINKALSSARLTQAGTVFINTFGSADITAPFGGYKQSGNGYKEKSKLALDAHSEKKTIWVEFN